MEDDKPPCVVHRPMTQRGGQGGRGWLVALSGGGTRAALCGTGALWAMHDRECRVEAIVSVSGGSLVNGGMLRAAPTDAEGRIAEFTRQFDTFRCRPETVATLIAVFGTAGLVALGAFGSPDNALIRTPLTLWGWLFVVASAVWFVSIAIAKVVLVPLVVYVVAVFAAAYDAAPEMECRAVGLCALAVVGVMAWRYARRSRALGKGIGEVSLASPDLVMGVVLAIYGVVMITLAPSHVGASQTRWSTLFEPMRGVGLVMVGWGAIGLVIMPHFMRTVIARLIGDDEREQRLGSPASGWRTYHAIATTDIRSEVPAVFTVNPRRPFGTAGCQSLFISASTSPLRTKENPTTVLNTQIRTDSRQVRLVDAIVASSAMVPVLAPVSPGGSAELPGFDPGHRFPLLVDGGLHGTLLTEAIELLAESKTYADDSEPPNMVLLDATRRRRSQRMWPIVFIPKFGQQFLQLRVIQTMLSSLVDEEREATLLPRQFNAVATGAAFAPLCTCAARSEPAWEPRAMAFERFLFEMRTRTDSLAHWWPGKRRALECLITGAAAVIYAIDGPHYGYERLRTLIEKIETQLGVTLDPAARADLDVP